MQDLVHALVRDDVGARALAAVALPRRWRGGDGRHRPDAADARRRACRAPHRSQARALGDAIDAGFGFEALGLAVTVAERMAAAGRAELASAGDPTAIGAGSVARRWSTASGSGSARTACGGSKPVASHLPERARDALCADDDRRDSRRRGSAPLHGRSRLPRAAAAAAARRAGRGHRARSRRPAAAFPLARHDCMTSPARRDRNASPANGGATERRPADARLLPGRGRRRPPLLALPRRTCTGARPLRHAGSCMGCLRDAEKVA